VGFSELVCCVRRDFLSSEGYSIMAPSWNSRATLTGHQTCWHLDIEPPASKTTRNEFLLFTINPVCCYSNINKDKVLLFSVRKPTNLPCFHLLLCFLEDSIHLKYVLVFIKTSPQRCSFRLEVWLKQ
jgi:hypothetical protein